MNSETIRIGIVNVTKERCPVCKMVIKRVDEWPDGKTYTKGYECSCNNQHTLEELAKAERIARAEKIRDLIEWGFHDKAHREDTFEKDKFKDISNDEVSTMKLYATNFLEEFYPENLGRVQVRLSEHQI